MTEIYSKSIDFPNGIIPSQIINDIEENITITTQVNGISIDGDVVKIIFASALSAPEITELNNNIVSSYTPSPILLENNPTGPTGPPGVSFIGPTGVNSNVTGPTGPPSNITGPTGESIIGPTGQSIIGPTGKSITGPTGQPGEDSNVTGPTGKSIIGPTGESIIGPTGQPGESIIGPTGLPGQSFTGPTGPQQEASINDKRVITVGPSNADSTTISGAVTLVTALSPTQANPATIFVYQGQYIETNSIVLPDYVTLSGSGAFSTTVIAAVPTNTIVSVGNRGRVVSITLAGAAAPGGKGILCDAGITSNYITDNLIIANCYTSIEVNSGTALLLHTRAATTTGVTIDKGVFISGSGEITGQTLGVINGGGTINYGIYVDTTGSDSKCSAVNITGCVVGLKVVNSSLYRISGGVIKDCDTSIHLDTGGIINILNTGIDNSTTWDIDISDSNCEFLGYGNRIQLDKINNPQNAEFNSGALSTQEGNKAVQISNLHVGSYNFPAKSAFGGGESTIQTMNVFRKTSGGTYSDVTTEASSAIGSTFSAFSETSVGAELYIGGIFKFPGLKMIIDTITSSPETYFISEYWNGSTWTEFYIMWSESENMRLTYAQQHFQNIGNYQLRFGEMKDWDLETINTKELYWVRFRLTTLITVIPVIEQIKLHTNRSVINTDGFIEFFGSARNTKTLSWSVNDARAFGNSPLSQDLFITDGIGRGYVENEFDGSSVRRIGNNFKVPFDFDSSYPLVLTWGWKNDSNTGIVRWRIRWAFHSPGEQIFNTSGSASSTAPNNSQQTLIVDETVPSTAGDTIISKAKIDFHNVIPDYGDGSSDTLWIVLERDGTEDSNSSITYLIDISPYYVSWRQGGSLGSLYD